MKSNDSIPEFEAVRRRQDFRLGREGLLPSREAALDISPGRQPWVDVCRDEPALKGRQNGVLSPFQGSRSTERQTQGLRPGLMSNAASRLGQRARLMTPLRGF